MTDLTIPREALEAAKREYINCEDDDNCIEAACLAMLKAWPGMTHIIEGEPGRENAEIILPLPKENTDAKA